MPNSSLTMADVPLASSIETSSRWLILRPPLRLAGAVLGVVLSACMGGSGRAARQPTGSVAQLPSAFAPETLGCSPEHGRTSAEFLRGSRIVDVAPSSTRAGLVALVTDGFARRGGSRAEPVTGAIVEYRLTRADDLREPWLGRLRADTVLRGRYASDSIPAATYDVRVRAIARKSMTYEVTLRPGWRDTLRIELAGASLCLGAPTTRSR